MTWPSILRPVMPTGPSSTASRHSGWGRGATPPQTARAPAVRDWARAYQRGRRRYNGQWLQLPTASTAGLERLNIGRYGANFLVRAEVAQTGWGANIPQEAVYINSTSDGHGDPYSGSRSYVLRFPAGSLPPAKAFWSLTVYGPDKFLVANAENRYSIGSHTPGLQTNPDGSLDLYLQATPPTSHTSNWLPIPTGAFTLTMRIYVPLPPVLLGSYRLPPVEPSDS